MCEKVSKEAFNLWLAWVSGKVQGVRMGVGSDIEDVARGMEMPLIYLQRVEAGDISPSGKFLKKFAQYYGMKEEDFFIPDRLKSQPESDKVE